jgi:hypothetical protein
MQLQLHIITAIFFFVTRHSYKCYYIISPKMFPFLQLLIYSKSYNHHQIPHAPTWKHKNFLRPMSNHGVYAFLKHEAPSHVSQVVMVDANIAYFPWGSARITIHCHKYHKSHCINFHWMLFQASFHFWYICFIQLQRSANSKSTCLESNRRSPSQEPLQCNVLISSTYANYEPD